jgi:trans-2,3-dihydro-3-hydroxyanthranilate isomerase
MPNKPLIYLVDVFAESAYRGNPLAVVIGSDALSKETMQLIAAEMNFSETTFVPSENSGDNSYRVRIFTPSQEIDFAGHPILGTAWVIRQYVLAGNEKTLSLNIGVGPVTVRFTLAADNRETVWFRAPPVSFGETCDRNQLANALGLEHDDIDDNSPAQKISANTSAMIVPLRSLDALRRSKLDLNAYGPLAARGFPPLIYLFSRQTHDSGNDLCARFFFDANGVREDPATGNGAAFLGYYLLQHQLYPEPELFLRIEQGHEVRRPSLVMLYANKKNGEYKVEVGGYVVPVMGGQLA